MNSGYPFQSNPGMNGGQQQMMSGMHNGMQGASNPMMHPQQMSQHGGMMGGGQPGGQWGAQSMMPQQCSGGNCRCMRGTAPQNVMNPMQSSGMGMGGQMQSYGQPGGMNMSQMGGSPGMMGQHGMGR